jgi:ribose transport system substrate-binding protein
MSIFRIYPTNSKEEEMLKGSVLYKLVAGLMLATMLLSACAAPTASVPTVAPAPATQAPAATVAPAPATQAPVATAKPTVCGGEIAVIVKTGNSGYWQNVQSGAIKAASELKPNCAKLYVSFLGPQTESNITEEINMVESAIDRGVKAIVLAPSDTSALIPAVQDAKKAGIPVIIIDSALSGDPSNYTAFLATDNKAAGEACGKAMVDALTAKGITSGKIQIMSYVKGVGSEVGRVGGFTDYIQTNSKFTLLETQYSNSDMPTALNQTTNVLTANPDLVGIFGANEPTAIGMGSAIKNANLGGKIVAIGFDGAAQLQADIKDGTLQAIAVQSSFNLGYLGVKDAFDVAFNSKTIPATVDTGFLMVTKDNIDSQDAKNVLY